MPIIPGLAGEPVDEPTIQDLIAALSDDDIAQLEEEAAAYVAGDAPDDAMDAPLDAPADDAAPLDGEAPVEGDEGPSPRDALEATRSAKYSIDDVANELQSLVDQAGEHEKAGMDMDGLEALLQSVTDAQDAADGFLEDAQKGADGDDAAAAATAASSAAKLVTTSQQALGKAKRLIAKSAKAALDTAVPDDVLAFDAWASRYQGG